MEDLNNQNWTREDERGSFLVSTKLGLLDHGFINNAFATDEMFWASKLPKDQLAKALSQSVTVGLYEVLPAVPPPSSVDEPSSPRDGSPTTDGPLQQSYKQIGLARLVTDHVTMAYLSDVYVTPEKRGLGLFKWMIGCIKKILHAHPALRRALLLTGSERLEKIYERDLGFWNSDKETHLNVMCRQAVRDDEVQGLP